MEYKFATTNTQLNLKLVNEIWVCLGFELVRLGRGLGATRVTREQGQSLELFEYPKSSQQALRTNI